MKYKDTEDSEVSTLVERNSLHWWESENQKWRRTKVDPQRKIKAVEKEERISVRKTEGKGIDV